MTEQQNVDELHQSKTSYTRCLFKKRFTVFFIYGCTKSSLLQGLSLVVVSSGSSLVAACRRLTGMAPLIAEQGCRAQSP